MKKTLSKQSLKYWLFLQEGKKILEVGMIKHLQSNENTMIVYTSVGQW